MSASPIVRDWRHYLRHDVFPDLHGHTCNALADLSFAMVAAGHCQAAKIAADVPTDANPASAARRLGRFLTKETIRPRLLQLTLATTLLEPWAGRRLVLILDETPLANHLRAMTIRLAYHQRTIPLATAVYRPHAPPQPLPRLIGSLLRQVRRALPPRSEVVLLADRGLAWPVLVDWCQANGWHYVFRLQSQTRVRFDNGTECAARDLITRRGDHWFGEATVFKKAGWRGANLVATWERDMAEPWLLLTDEPASTRQVRRYGQRMWTEESYRDEKSSGFHWEQSRVRDPDHAARLLLLVALAMVLALSLGSQMIKAGHRRELDPHPNRRLSYFQLGLRWLPFLLRKLWFCRLRLRRLYLYP